MGLSRKSKRHPSGEIRSEQEALEALASSLNEVKSHLFLIERGENLASRTLAVIIHRIISQELSRAFPNRRISMDSFLKPETSDRSVNIYPLTSFEVTEHGTRIVPVPLHDKENKSVVPFNQWKNGIVFYGEYRVDGSDRRTNLPFLNLTREKLVKNVRNEIGAHFDNEVSSGVHHISSDKPFLDLRVSARGGVPTKPTAKVPHKYSYLSATIATIGIELLSTFSVPPRSD